MLAAGALAGPFLGGTHIHAPEPDHVLAVVVPLLLALALAKGLVVLGLLLLMRTGLVSFGQGLYFGLGAYAAALLANRAGLADAALMIVAGTASAAAVAAILGLLLARYRAYVPCPM